MPVLATLPVSKYNTKSTISSLISQKKKKNRGNPRSRSKLYQRYTLYAQEQIAEIFQITNGIIGKEKWGIIQEQIKAEKERNQQDNWEDEERSMKV